MAAYFNVLLMLSLGFQFLKQARWQRILLAAYSLSAMLLIFLASSRGAWVGAAVGISVLVFAFVAHTGVDLRATWQKQRRRVGFWLAAAGLTSLIAIVASLYMGRLMNHPTHGPALTSRSPFWSVGWDMFRRSPLVGSGWNVYASFWMRAHSAPPVEIFLHSHNQFLDVLACSGILGAVALLFFLAVLFKVSRERWNATGGNERVVLIGVLAACAAYCAHGFFDGLYRMPFASLSLVVVLGAAFAQMRPVSRWLRFSLAVLGVALVAFGLFNTWRMDTLWKGVQAANEGHLPLAVSYLLEAARRDPNFAIAHQQLGLVLSMQAEEREPGALDKAITAFERAAFLDPDWGQNYANQGALYLEKGDLESAAESFRKAAEAAPGASSYWLSLGEAEEGLGSIQPAEEAYLKALTTQPDLYPSAFWRETTPRSEASASFIREYSANPANLAEIQQKINIGQGEGIDFIELAKGELQTEDLAAARQNLGIASLAYFNNGFERVELAWTQAELAAAEGNMDEAVRLGKQALEAVQSPGVYGPWDGRSYAELVFHAPEIGEVVPQMRRIDLNNTWSAREAESAEW